MEKAFSEGKIFDKVDFTAIPLKTGDYEECRFINCNFSSSDLTEIKFSECEFVDCNLSMAKLMKTAFRNVKFRDCKMLGLRFENCNQFGFAVSFEDCNLNHSSFYQSRLKKIIFKNVQLLEVDFTESDLTCSVFENCDLTGATFDSTILEKADLRTSFNYSIDPEINRIKKARFSLSGITGLLHKYDIEIDRAN